MMTIVIQVDAPPGQAIGVKEHLPRYPGLGRAISDPAGVVAAGDVHHKIF